MKMEYRISEFVRENRMLYDKKHGLYSNHKLKDSKWKELAEEINVPVESLKKRWKTMRDRFMRVHKNGAVESCDQNGQGPLNKKVYKYNDCLLFLSEVECYNARPFEEFKNEESVLYEESFVFAEEPSCSTMSNDTHSSTYATTPQKRKRTSDAENDVLSLPKRMKLPTTECESLFRSFLHSVALTVESANLNLQQMTRLQINILKLVQEQLNSGSS